jgi:cytochrome c-type biogenesis protein CcmH
MNALTKKRFGFTAILALSLHLSAWANEPTPAVVNVAPTAQPMFADAAIETRLTLLSRELRCVVCQNEALSESPAELASDMRQEIRELMKAGKTDQEVLDFLTSRYGDFVLFRPPFKPLTYLLWVGPFVFLGFGVLIWFMALRARRTFKSAPVSHEQIAAAARLLEEKP